MFAVIARFPAAPEHKTTLLTLLEESLVITEQQPGFVAHQLLAPRDNDDMRVCLMLWESPDAFRSFVKSDASKQAHAGIRPEFFSDKPTIEELDVLSTVHSATPMA